MNIGGWLLGVRADTGKTAAAVRNVFDSYLAESGPRLPSNFSLRAQTGLIRRRPGALYIGGSLIASSRSLSPLLRTLSSYLAGLAGVEPRLSRVAMRVFVRDGHAVLVHLERPLLVDDRRLRDAGIIEAHLWQPVIDPDHRSVLVPELLPAVDWGRHGGAATAVHPSSMAIVGVVARPGDDGAPDLRATCAHALYNRDAWLSVLDHLCEHQLVRAADGEVAGREAIRSLLG